MLIATDLKKKVSRLLLAKQKIEGMANPCQKSHQMSWSNQKDEEKSQEALTGKLLRALAKCCMSTKPKILPSHIMIC